MILGDSTVLFLSNLYNSGNIGCTEIQVTGCTTNMIHSEANLSLHLVLDMKFIYFQFKENASAIYNKLSECKAIVFLIFERSEQTIALYIQFANFMYHNYMVWIYREFSFMVLILLAIYKIWIESNFEKCIIFNTLIPFVSKCK